MPNTTDVISEADLKPLQDDVDHRFAGELLDPWLGYLPEDSLTKAMATAAERPGERIIAFVVPRDPKADFATYIEHQRRAGRAAAIAHYPHLKMTFRTLVAPFRGIGSDVRVFYVIVGKAPDGS